MFVDQCISITDLKKNPSRYMKDLGTPKYIFVNNRPKAVLVDVSMFEAMGGVPYIKTEKYLNDPITFSGTPEEYMIYLQAIIDKE